MAPGLFDDSWLNKLALFGLTHLQAKIYVSTHILGEVPVRTIQPKHEELPTCQQ